MSRDVKRVPMDWDWPLGKVWDGFFMPEHLHGEDCYDCSGRGDTPAARHLHNLWYGYEPFQPEDNGSTPFTPYSPPVRAFAERQCSREPRFYGHDEAAIVREGERLCGLWNRMWSHHLNADDVAALIEAGRLRDLTHSFDPDREPRFQPHDPMPEITPEMVNNWAIGGFGHDGINAWVVIGARAKREGIETRCARCDGHGSIETYPGQREEAENWHAPEPPIGDGWQLWETVSEGSPVSPVFASDEELAQWLTTPEGGEAAGPSRRPLTISQARGFVGVGWAPSGFMDAGGVHDGVTYIGTREAIGD